MLLALLAVILLAISMLYCLGFASLAVRQTWENAPLPWNGTKVPEDEVDLLPTASPAATELPVTEGP